MRVLDLFCGCGGMSKGLSDAGFTVVAGVDIWDKAVESYNANANHAYCEDLTRMPPEEFHRKYNVEHIDLLVGGPPCQSFSLAGKRDKHDPRNALFMEYVNYLNYYKPKAFLMENVIGILSKRTETGEKVIDIIMEHLERDYRCIVTKLCASDFGVPQNRRRVIILGIRKDLNMVPTEPKPMTRRLSVNTILEVGVDRTHFLSQRALDGIAAKKQRSKAKGLGFGAQFLNVDKPSYTIPARYWKDGYDALVRYSDTEVRRLTIGELKAIQSFPPQYTILGSKKEIIMQIGNAVPCTFAYYLGLHILYSMSSSRRNVVDTKEVATSAA